MKTASPHLVTRWPNLSAVARFGWLFLMASSLLPLVRAEAQDDVTAAANAFSRAQRAELAGDHARAAELFELADSIAPAPEALRSAARQRLAAEHHATAATHAEELLSRYPDQSESRKLARSILDQVGDKLMRYRIVCREAPCRVRVDGRAASSDADREHVVYLEPGKHEVAAVFEGRGSAEPREVSGKPGERTNVVFSAPPVPEPEENDPASVPVAPASAVVTDEGEPAGVSPWFFGVGAIVTAGLGGVLVWSGLDVLDKHDEYEAAPTREKFEDGQDRERRTNILIGVTAAAGAATLAVALFGTNWSGGESDDERAAIGFSAGPDGAMMEVGGSF
jgi:hypothetical protein